MFELLFTELASANGPGSYTSFTPDNPLGRTRHCSTILDGKIYVFGGLAPGGADDPSFVVYDINTGEWQTLTSPGVTRWEASMFSYQGNIYVFGGMPRSGNYFNNIIEYNVAEDSWSTYVTFDSTYASASATAMGPTAGTGENLVYVNPGISNSTVIRTFDMQTMTWATIAKTGARAYVGMAAIGNDVHIATGYNYAGNSINVYHEIYNTVTKTWSSSIIATVGLRNVRLVSTGEDIYFVGGRNSSNALSAVLKRYNGSTKTWANLSDVGLPREFSTLGYSDGKLYSVGGNTLTSGQVVPSYCYII